MKMQTQVFVRILNVFSIGPFLKTNLITHTYTKEVMIYLPTLRPHYLEAVFPYPSPVGTFV